MVAEKMALPWQPAWWSSKDEQLLQQPTVTPFITTTTSFTCYSNKKLIGYYDVSELIKKNTDVGR